MVKIEYILPAADDTMLYLLVSDDAGVSFEADAGDYKWGANLIAVGAGAAVVGSASATQIVLTSDISAGKIGTTAGENGYCGEIYFSSPDIATRHQFQFTASYMDASARLATITGAGIETGGLAIDGLRFIMSSGNIASGTIRLYGVAK